MKLAKSLVLLVFLALMISPILLRYTYQGINEGSNSPEQANISQSGFYLDEVALASGINFKHQAPLLDQKIAHIMALIASMGASISICDYDNDGWSDLYLTNSLQGTQNALYRNNGTGQFVDVSPQLGLADVNKTGTGVSMGAVWGDYNNDGYRDLFLYKWGKPELFQNIEGREFRNVTASSGLPEWLNANTAIWADFNNDSLLDLFIGGYYRENIDLWHLASTNFMHESFEYANNGGRNYLLINKGDGSFKDVTFSAGLNSRKWTLAAGALDINNDNFPELMIANDYGIDELYLNIQGQTFEEIGKDMELGFAPKSGMNISFGDVENSGQLGIYVTNITEEGVLLQGNNMWMPEIKDDNLVYKNYARSKGIELGGWSYGAQFGDFNNDGFNDLYVANGYISGKKGTSYWYDQSKISGGSKAIISDARNWPAMEGRSQSGYQQNKIWLNDGHGRYIDVSEKVCEPNPKDSRAVSLADLWNRGVLDIVVANQNGAPFVYKNNSVPGNHWIDVDLIGTVSNRDAIGARVEVIWDDQRQMQVITGGIGFSGQNQHRLHFGIGKSAGIDKLIVYWPSGAISTVLKPDIDRLHTLKEQLDNS